MSDEFSLLQHLGVTVDGDGPPSRRGQTTAASKEAFRVWAPMQHPPSRLGRDEEAHEVLERRRRGARPAYADPTGEVLLRREHGAEVQYVVYNSKVPSIYGVNKQLAERKRAERQQGATSALVDYGLDVGDDEAKQEAARRELLRELRQCNQEQARQRREEERRDRDRRIAHERAILQYNAAEAARQEEEALQLKAAREWTVREAAAAAVAARERRGAPPTTDAGTAWSGKDEDDRRRLAVLQRTREFAEENWRIAEQRRVERQAQRQEELERARAEQAELQRQLAEEHAKGVARHVQDAEALRGAQEAERERRWRASAAEAHRQAQPSGSLFDAVEERERGEATRAQQKVLEDMAVNARLAAEKRAGAQADRDKERRYALESARAEMEDLQREAAQTRERRHHERAQLQEAAEAAAAARLAHAASAKERSTDPLRFWPSAQSPRAEEAKSAEARRFLDELHRHAEQRRRMRAQDEEAERARERALVEYDARAAEAAAAQERREAREKAEQLRRTLDAQIAQKRSDTEAARRGRAAAVGVTQAAATVETHALYRCPITGELLPASAYDFGVQRGR